MTIRISPQARRSRSDETLRREGVREVTAAVEGAHTDGRAIMEHAKIACQKGAAVHDGMTCVWCRRFVNFVPGADRATVTVRCIWTSNDTVADLMTRASALVTVPPDLRAADAAALARQRGLRHLLVVEGDELIGVTSRVRLDAVGPAAPVREAVAPELWVVSHSATLGEAIALLVEHCLTVLPVAQGDALCGVLSDGDLVDAGLI